MQASADTFRIGSALSTTFAVMRRHVFAFALLGTIFVIPLQIAEWYAYRALPQVDLRLLNSDGFGATTYIANYLVMSAIQYPIVALAQGALVVGAIANLTGQPVSLLGCLRASLKNSPQLVLISVLDYVAVTLAWAFLIVPGLLLSSAWFLVYAVRVMEGRSVAGCFARSRELTRGHVWSLLALLVAIYVAEYVLTLFVRDLSTWAYSSNLGASDTLRVIGFYLVNGLYVVAEYAAVGVLTGVIYRDLYREKHGIPPEQLATVFE